MTNIDVTCPYCKYTISIPIEMGSEPIWKVIHCREVIKMSFERQEFGCGRTYVAEIGWISEIKEYRLEYDHYMETLSDDTGVK